jgi:mannan endo-1,4-beta-mannosidase
VPQHLTRSTIAALSVSVAVALAQPRPLAAPADKPEFVRVRGAELVIGDRPFRFVGANLSIMHHPENRARAEHVLTEAARDGIRVGRIWALGEGTVDATPWQRDNFLFRAGPTGWVDAATDHLDKVIAAAGRAGIRLVITLSNNWSDYGGAPMYLRWAGLRRDDVYGAADAFYSDRQTRAAFRAHLERLLRRTNAVTGVPYRDDPTIMAWELMNESQVMTAPGAAARRAWIVEMAHVIRTLAPHQLITPGVSSYRLERERKDWLAICQLPEVDICDGHIYPEEILRNRDPAVLDAVLDDFVQLSQHVAGKPFVLGEFGIRGDAAGLWLGKSRASWIATILGRLDFDRAAGGLLWIYQPGKSTDLGHGIGVGDPRSLDIRRTLGTLALRIAREPPSRELNPLLGGSRGEAPFLPLHAEFKGEAAVIPFAKRSGTGLRVSWDPATYHSAYWEATGVYTGGAIEHAWGGESGWFEYAYDVATPPVSPARKAKAAPGVGRRLSVRARVSSEYPGTLSPPDGVSAFEVSLDGLRVAASVAARDDGLGRWVTLHTSDRAALRAATAPGRHLLRFAVPSGPLARGLCLYGRPGAKPPAAPVRTGPVELTVN